MPGKSIQNRQAYMKVLMGTEKANEDVNDDDDVMWNNIVASDRA